MSGSSDDGRDSRGAHVDGRYPVPASGIHRSETTTRRSRFIASLTRARDPDEARAFVGRVEAEWPDATHHCWAFVAGPPGVTSHIGMSDAGEPHGTAGRPMLNVLLHSGVGEVVAVVTRYFGGVKLGTGGLARAYAEAVTEALAGLGLTERVEVVRVRIEVPFAALDTLHRALDALDARDTTVAYGTGATIEADLPTDAVDALAGQVASATAGAGRLDVI